MPKRVAVVLSGCGFLDGSEIHEATSVLIHLDLLGLEAQCFAPDIPQSTVVNHATGSPTHETRSVLAESARIARGKVRPMAQLHAKDFAAVVFPGGFGAAKNLCTFATDGANCRVLPDVARVIKEFHAARKPLAMCCIAPVLAAKVLGPAGGGEGCTVTMGNDPGVIGAMARLDVTHVVKGPDEIVIDKPNRLVTCPAYMDDTTPGTVFRGVGRMLEAMAMLMTPEPAHA